MRNRPLAPFAALVCGLLLGPATLPAAASVDIVINGNEATATVTLPGGVGAEVGLRFEQVVGLSAPNLGLGAQLINPVDPEIRARLPGGGTSIPAVFPFLLTIEPPATGGLSFSGVVDLELHTENLHLGHGSPLRLFGAPAGGPFEDITASVGMGSYRARGSRGDFSEFLIAIDLRSANTVTGGKFDALRARLEEFEPLIEPTVFGQLDSLLAAALAAYDAGQYLQAADQVASFAAAVEAASGDGIPDVWRSTRDLANVAGLLRSGAHTLEFSLRLRRGGRPL